MANSKDLSKHSLFGTIICWRQGRWRSQGICHDSWTFKKPKTKPEQQKFVLADTSYLWVLLGERWHRSARAHTNNPPSRTEPGKSWKMLPRPLLLLLPFLPIIKVKTSEFFLRKKQTEHRHNISCWGTLWDLADLGVQLKAGIWTGGVALQEKSRFL